MVNKENRCAHCGWQEKRKTETEMGGLCEKIFGLGGVWRKRDRVSDDGSETGSVMEGEEKS